MDPAGPILEPATEIGAADLIKIHDGLIPIKGAGLKIVFPYADLTGVRCQPQPLSDVFGVFLFVPQFFVGVGIKAHTGGGDKRGKDADQCGHSRRAKSIGPNGTQWPFNGDAKVPMRDHSSEIGVAGVPDGDGRAFFGRRQTIIEAQPGDVAGRLGTIRYRVDRQGPFCGQQVVPHPKV